MTKEADVDALIQRLTEERKAGRVFERAEVLERRVFASEAELDAHTASERKVPSTLVKSM